jgi:hypothetical protein
MGLICDILLYGPLPAQGIVASCVCAKLVCSGSCPKGQDDNRCKMIISNIKKAEALKLISKLANVVIFIPLNASCLRF